MTAEQLITALQLQPLSLEGGYYRETYRSDLELPLSALQRRYRSAKAASTAIYYLLTPDTFSALHRLPTDELYHFYLGDPVELLQLDETGGRVVTLGPDILAGQCVQSVVRGGVWQGSVLKQGGAFALLGTTMAPGFDFSDYEAGVSAHLTARYPDFADRIARLCSK
jgi:predicted cupin superfamily sugar epimerase